MALLKNFTRKGKRLAVGATGNKVPITVRALIQRINRKLKPDNQQLKVTRGQRWRSNLGDYYIVDTYRNNIVNSGIDPESYGRKLGCIEAYETVVEE